MNSLLQTTGSLVLSLVVNGTPVEARFLVDDGAACALAARQASTWRREKRLVIEQRSGEWCVAGTVINDQWVAVQWRRAAQDRQSNGWHVRMPLRAIGPSVPVSDMAPTWNLDVVDRGIQARMRFRQSSNHLDAHHHGSERALGMTSSVQELTPSSAIRLSRRDDGRVLVSGRHPSGGSYSVVIDREAVP